jgi:uncharacterized membrane protein YdjX (TVP38/TMEM64 family)
MGFVRRFLPLLTLAVLLLAALAAGLSHQLSWPVLARYHTALTRWVAEHPRLAPLLYMLGYVAVAALSVPEAALVTVAGGLLFGTWLGGALAVVGSTLGASILFLVARRALAGSLVRRGGTLLACTRAALQREGFAYLLAIRLVPAFPFWLVNLAAAFGGMRLMHFAAATLIGVIPGTLVLASVGASLGDVLARGERPDLGVLFRPQILLPLLALAALSLLPAAWRRWRKQNA